MTVEIRVGRIVRAVVMVVVVPGKLSLDIGLSNAISVTMFCFVWFGSVCGLCECLFVGGIFVYKFGGK